MQQQVTYLTYSVITLLIAVFILSVITIIERIMQDRLNELQHDLNHHFAETLELMQEVISGRK